MHANHIAPLQLLFVYNADSGLHNALFDAVHKLVSPGTYPCSLCSVTYGATRMRPEWKQFLRNLPVPVKFLYRNQLSQRYPQLLAHKLPAVFSLSAHDEYEVVVSAEALANLTLNGLINTLHTSLLTPPVCSAPK
ncbi:hypothetical protein ASU33_11950 [Solirubrum puertoriconensis]|uniref:GTPase n=1 Tax=Solirubrum puertoriconensis TaxID=1751427 RepID=A0A9X0HMT4_SOLP1|nr:hypothetical protein ASU33_11950 [Solirubrum puertoriconensis]